MTLHNKENKLERKARLHETNEERITLSFYQYYNIVDPQGFRDRFYSTLEPLKVYGRIYVASEGVNAQISVPQENWELFKTAMDEIDFLKGIRLNIAVEDDGKSFYVLKIKVRPKIVADGLDDDSFDVTDRGVHLSAKAYNKLVEDPDTVVVDMRNHYESEVGHMEGAMTPDVETFRASLPIVEELLEPHREKNIVMYCTGGIRCEKASAYFKHKGFKKVHQLEGGIIEYTHQVNAQGLENKFLGKNFVFDDRMGERISNEIISSCHQCGTPCDDHVNCANSACHILFIQCKDCAIKNKNCCSAKCSDFMELDPEKQRTLRPTMEFNGTKFGKGRYKAHHKDETLD